jgi:hypothetical protein
MKERIDIWVDEAVIAENDLKSERLARTYRLEPADRAPVWVDATFWGLLAARGVTFGEFISSPRDHLRHQILNYKWRIEQFRDDLPVETRRLVFQPDFGALRGTEFPIEVEWLPDQPAKSKHLLTEPEQIDTLPLPDPTGGLNARKIEFYRGMQAAREDFDVRLNGQPLAVDVTISQPGGPIPSAFALCGSNLFLWIKTDPDRVHHLLDLVTKSHLNCIACFDKLTGTHPDHFIWVGADAGDMMSPKTFREFGVPYYNRLWQQYTCPPRIFHMCGRINHLLEIIRDDLKVERLDGFGFPVDRHQLAEKWAGRLVMRGGPHPMLIHDGPAAAILAECESYLRTAGSRGGFILSEGFGLMPGTPPAHVAAMVQASINVAAKAV